LRAHQCGVITPSIAFSDEPARCTVRRLVIRDGAAWSDHRLIQTVCTVKYVTVPVRCKGWTGLFAIIGSVLA